MGTGVTMAGPSNGPDRPKEGPLNWRWVAALMVLLAAFLGLRGLRALQPEPSAAPLRAGTVVVVGVTDRSSLTGSDRILMDSHSSAVQFAAVCPCPPPGPPEPGSQPRQRSTPYKLRGIPR